MEKIIWTLWEAILFFSSSKLIQDNYTYLCAIFISFRRKIGLLGSSGKCVFFVNKITNITEYEILVK